MRGERAAAEQAWYDEAAKTEDGRASFTDVRHPVGRTSGAGLGNGSNASDPRLGLHDARAPKRAPGGPALEQDRRSGPTRKRASASSGTVEAPTCRWASGSTWSSWTRWPRSSPARSFGA